MRTRYTKEELEAYGGFNVWYARLEDLEKQREKIEVSLRDEEKTIAKWLFSNIIAMRKQCNFKDISKVFPNINEKKLVDLEKECLKILKNAGEDPREHNYYFDTELSETWNKRITKYFEEL